MRPFTRRCRLVDVFEMLQAAKDGDLERWSQLHARFLGSWNKSAPVLIEGLVHSASILSKRVPVETLGAQADTLTDGPEGNPAAARSRRLLAQSLFGSAKPGESFIEALADAGQDPSLSSEYRVYNILSMVTTAALLARNNDVDFLVETP